MPLATAFAAGIAAMTLIVAARYLAVSGAFALVTRRLRPEVYAPAEPRERARLARQMRAEVRWSLLAAFIYAVPAGIVAVGWRELGWSAIYSDPYEYGLLWLPGSVLLYLFLHDTYFYWSHRAMHHPRLFRPMHAVHHDSRPPTAWAAMSFHPWESLAGALVIPGLALIIPIHWAALLVVLTVMTFFGVTNHMGWEIFPRSWVHGPFGKAMITASHHHLHHRHYRCNYGLYFRFWDRVCGTDRGLARELDHEPHADPAPRSAAAAAAGAGR